MTFDLFYFNFRILFKTYVVIGRICVTVKIQNKRHVDAKNISNLKRRQNVPNLENF